ncbi:MAG TPA: TIGR03435 family protein [Bryobacteraceae bacterium]
MKRKLSVFVALLFLCRLAGVGQTSAVPPHDFEAASIKPNDGPGNNIEVKPGMVLAHSAMISTCLIWAWGVQRPQVVGADAAIESRLNSDRYEIVAKAAAALPDDELKVMFRRLLEARFSLEIRHEKRDLAAFELVLDRKGPKLHESASDTEKQEIVRSKINREWKATTMAEFTQILAEGMNAPVIDATGLNGRYDFAIDLTPYLAGEQGRVEVATLIPSALPEQLGLRLRAKKTSVETLVVTRLEKPSAN